MTSGRRLQIFGVRRLDGALASGAVINDSFLKRNRPVRFGFAAGFEAAALPRRRCAFLDIGLCPWSGLWPNKFEGLSPN